jgi:chorismate mutase
MDLADWREKIDKLDLKLLDLLNERTSFVFQLIPLKRQKAIPVEEPEREAAVRDNIRRNNRGPLSDEALCRIFDAIMEEMKAVQKDELRTEKRRPRREPAAARSAPKRSSRADVK